LPHIVSIKYMEPTLSDEQLQIILNKLLHPNPVRPDLANRTFGRRRRRIQQQLQPPPEPTIVLDTHTTELNFTISIEHRPQARPTLSLIASLPYCVCCLCGYDHSTPDCPPSSSLPTSPHICQLQTTEEDPTDPPTPLPQALLPETDWTALHWDIWQAQDLTSLSTPMVHNTGPQDPTPPDCPARPSRSRRLRSQTTIQMYFSPITPSGHTISVPTNHHRSSTTHTVQQPTPTIAPHSATLKPHHLNQINLANQLPTSCSTSSTAAPLHSSGPT
jgi:hypothetical protein